MGKLTKLWEHVSDEKNMAEASTCEVLLVARTSRRIGASYMPYKALCVPTHVLTSADCRYRSECDGPEYLGNLHNEMAAPASAVACLAVCVCACL